MTLSTTTELRDGTWSVLTDRTTAAFTARGFGLIRVRGTIPVGVGAVTVVSGQPVAAAAELVPAGTSTGIRKRDSDLAGPRFFDTERHPVLGVRVRDVRPTADGWTDVATLLAACARHGMPVVPRGAGTSRLPGWRSNSAVLSPRFGIALVTSTTSAPITA